MKQPEVLQRPAARVMLAHQARQWASNGGRFVRTQPLGAAGLIICSVLVFMGVFAPWVVPYDPNVADHTARLVSPGASHWFGTDELGRDLYSRIIHGTRVSLVVAFFSIGIGKVFGYFLGVVSGYVGGRVDLVLQRVIDAMLAFPTILLALTLVAVLGSGLEKTVAAISIVFFPSATRIARGTVLSVKENVYVDAARVIGASPLRLIMRHILPNSLAPFFIVASAALGAAILVEASLSFLGLGVPPPHPSWGRMLAGSAEEFGLVAPWLVIAPGVAIMVLVLAFNLLGDSVRDLLDPRLRGR